MRDHKSKLTTKECPYCGSNSIKVNLCSSDMFNTVWNCHCLECNKFYEVEE
jgi:hypothetical protein